MGLTGSAPLVFPSTHPHTPRLVWSRIHSRSTPLVPRIWSLPSRPSEPAFSCHLTRHSPHSWGNCTVSAVINLHLFNEQPEFDRELFMSCSCPDLGWDAVGRVKTICFGWVHTIRNIYMYIQHGNLSLADTGWYRLAAERFRFSNYRAL